MLRPLEALPFTQEIWPINGQQEVGVGQYLLSNFYRSLLFYEVIGSKVKLFFPPFNLTLLMSPLKRLKRE